MFGFRRHLSTQNILLQIKEDVMGQANRHTPKAIMALDLKGAFDNVTHQAILTNLNSLDSGTRTYNYVRDFLSNRKAILRLGDLSSGPIDVGGRGTPRGAVLSPLLFNIALIGLPTILGAIPDLHHGLYAADISVYRQGFGRRDAKPSPAGR